MRRLHAWRIAAGNIRPARERWKLASLLRGLKMRLILGCARFVLFSTDEPCRVPGCGTTKRSFRQVLQGICRWVLKRVSAHNRFLFDRDGHGKRYTIRRLAYRGDRQGHSKSAPTQRCAGRDFSSARLPDEIEVSRKHESRRSCVAGSHGQVGTDRLGWSQRAKGTNTPAKHPFHLVECAAKVSRSRSYDVLKSQEAFCRSGRQPSRKNRRCGVVRELLPIAASMTSGSGASSATGR